MHQGLGSRWKVPGSELAFSTAEIFQTRSLGFPCRIWLAHSVEVNNFVVMFWLVFSPSNRIFFFFLIILIWFSDSVLFQSWYTFLAASEECGPSCCPWAVLLYWHRLDVVQLFTTGTASEMVPPLLSSVLCGLTCFLRAMSLELQLRSVPPSRLTATAEEWKNQSRIGGWRGQEKQRREWHSSNFSVSCWVCHEYLWQLRILWSTWQCASVSLVAMHARSPVAFWIQASKA